MNDSVTPSQGRPASGVAWLALIVSVFSTLVSVITATVVIMSYSQRGAHFSWRTISDHAPGNSGMVAALERLFSQGENLTDIDLVPRASAEDQKGKKGKPIYHRSSLVGAQLAGVDFSKGWFDHTDWTNANLKGATLYKARLNSSILDEADMTGATLTEASLRDARLHNTKAPGLVAEGVILEHSTVKGATFYGSNMSKSRIEGTLIAHSYLGKVLFSDAWVVETRFIYVDLTGADFTRAVMTDTRLSNANISGAIFTEASDVHPERWNQVWAWEDQKPTGLASNAGIAFYKASCKDQPENGLSRPPDRCLVR